MHVFSTELGIRLSFVKTSEFRGGGVNPQTPLLGTPLCLRIHTFKQIYQKLGEYIRTSYSKGKLRKNKERKGKE
jgi:hypothetical protein